MRQLGRWMLRDALYLAAVFDIAAITCMLLNAFAAASVLMAAALSFWLASLGRG